MPEADPDESLLMNAVRARGMDVRVSAWNDTRVDWGNAGLCVVRSTWDYHHHLTEFLEWCNSASSKSTVLNPSSVMCWNSHKRYMLELAETGIKIVPTEIVHTETDLSSAAQRVTAAAVGWNRAVIKPAVSGGSHNTYIVSSANNIDDVSKLCERILYSGDMLIQPFVNSVETYGERSLVWINGELTHSIRKNPRFANDQEKVSQAMSVANDEAQFADTTIAAASRCLKLEVSELLYARVDVARDEDGNLQLMELELIEPSLFLLQHPIATERFADAIAAKA